MGHHPDAFNCSFEHVRQNDVFERRLTRFLESFENDFTCLFLGHKP